MPKLVFAVAGLSALLAAASGAYGQAVPPAGGAGPVPEEIALDALRARTEIPQNDRTIDNWIAFRLDALAKGLDDPTIDAGSEFVKAYQAQLANPQSTDGFKQRLCEQSGKRFAAEFAKDAELEPRVALVLGRTLMELRSIATLDALAAGLKAKSRPVVRYYAAKTFVSLLPDIQADQARTGTTLQTLREAGIAESSGQVLSQIYEAMFYRERLGLALPAILDVFQEQLKLREGAAPGATGADEGVFAFLKQQVPNIQDKNRLVALLAARLRIDVNRYLTPGLRAQESRSLERTIDAVESLLFQIVTPANPAPNVRDAMKKLANQDINMPLELYKWIGTAQSPGILNGPPWNVPVGAPLAG